jgi:hypothetical protein
MANIPIRDIPGAVVDSPNPNDLIAIDNGILMQKTTIGNSVLTTLPLASQAEAEAGSDNFKRMSSLRVKQSIASQVGVTLASNAQGLKADTAVQSVNGKTGSAVALDKSDVGLGNVDNTSDVNKPISTETQTALDGKVATTSPRLMPSGGTADQVLAKSSNTDYATTWITSAAATAVSYAAQTLTGSQQEQARDNINSASNDDIGFAIVYPNGGSESSPANVSINSRYVNSNPFPGHEVICEAQIKPTGYEWGATGFIFIESSTSGTGVSSGIYNNQIVTQTGSGFLMGGSALVGSFFGFSGSLSAPTPCRVLVWKVT